jgi:hypothetical protein
MPTPENWAHDREILYQPDPRTIAYNTPIYGLHGRFIVMDGQEKSAYAYKAQEFIQALRPQGPIEDELALLFHDSLWCAKRARCDEQQVFNDHDHHETQGDGRAILRLNQYIVAREKTMFQAMRVLGLTQAARQPSQPRPYRSGAVVEQTPSPAEPKPPFDPRTSALWLVFERFLNPGNPIFRRPPIPEPASFPSEPCPGPGAAPPPPEIRKDLS